MDQPFYQFSILDNAHRFDFVSEGNRSIKKSVIYFATTVPDLYSLTLADVQEDNSLDVYVISDNGDMPKILSTVFHSISSFLVTYPNATVGFKGSTPSRTRLYQIAIAHELDRALHRFKIWGIRSDNSQPEPFQGSTRYEVFFISVNNP